MNDEKVYSLLTSPAALGVTERANRLQNRHLRHPGDGYKLRASDAWMHSRRISPELIQISGLSHGTDVWTGNADEPSVRAHVPSRRLSAAVTVSCCTCCARGFGTEDVL